MLAVRGVRVGTQQGELLLHLISSPAVVNSIPGLLGDGAWHIISHPSPVRIPYVHIPVVPVSTNSKKIYVRNIIPSTTQQRPCFFCGLSCGLAPLCAVVSRLPVSITRPTVLTLCFMMVRGRAQEGGCSPAALSLWVPWKNVNIYILEYLELYYGELRVYN